MHLLMVSPYLPHPSWGAGTGSYYLRKALAREHDASLLALVATPRRHQTWVYAFWRISHVLRHWSRVRPRAPSGGSACGASYLRSTYTLTEMQAAFDEMLARGHYDAVLFENVKDNG